MSEKRSGFGRFVSCKRLVGKFSVTKKDGECPQSEAELSFCILLGNQEGKIGVPKIKGEFPKSKLHLTFCKMLGNQEGKISVPET